MLQSQLATLILKKKVGALLIPKGEFHRRGSTGTGRIKVYGAPLYKIQRSEMRGSNNKEL